MLHVGVTGGIGSGKTTFLQVWERLGVPVVYADDMAKQLMVTDQDLKNQVIRTFGVRSYHTDGSLNRDFLAEAAFKAGRVEELNRIVHPAVYRELDMQKKKALRDGARLFAHESALLLTSGSPVMCDVVVMVACPEAERIRRVSARDGSSPESVQNRIRKQPDFDLLAEKADFLVRNDGPPGSLEYKAEALYRELHERAAGTKER